MGGLTFAPITLDAGDDIVVAPGHTAVPFLRWGDPIMAGAPEWDLNNQSAAAQEQQFGYNCDWIEFFPLPPGSDSSDHGLLVVNHEYTNPELMFPGYLTPNPEFDALATPDNAPPEIPEFLTNPTQEIVDVELAAHGLSVVEVQRNDAGQWAGRPGLPVQPAHHRHDPDRGDRPGRRHRPAADQRGPDRHAGVRHAQQLRRRQDALGHRADRRGELPAVLRQPGGLARRRSAPHPARSLRRRRGGFGAALGGVLPALRPRPGAERALPLRLGRRDRSLRPGFDAEEADRPRPRQARGRHVSGRAGGSGRLLHRR